MTALSLAWNSAAAWAQTRAAESSLPVGTPITIVSDETVDPRVRPGSEFRAHLRDPLALGDTLVAVAGTPARIVVVAKTAAADGSTTSYRIAIVGLNLGAAGPLPVRPDALTVDRITAGMPIPATTLATIGIEEGKVRVEIPLPFPLSNDTPAADYTPAPLRTASPLFNGRPHRGTRPGPSPSPSPAASPAPSGTPAAPGSPAPSSSPASAASAAPEPSGTARPAATSGSPAPAASASPASAPAPAASASP